jgi:Kelch motif
MSTIYSLSIALFDKLILLLRIEFNVCLSEKINLVGFGVIFFSNCSLIMKFIIVIAFIKALAITVESIPSQGSPVSKLYYHSTVYEDESSTIYILGGTDSARDMETNGIYTYNISTNKWAQISPESDFIPSGFQHHVSYINNNQEILTFFRTSSSQYLSDVLVFDIKTYFWSTKVLMGDVIKGRKLYSSCRLLYNNVDYMALYGGFTRDGYDSNLYL